MNKLLEITVYYMCFLGVILVFLVCILMQYLLKIQGFIHVILMYYCVNCMFFPEKTPFNIYIYVKYMVFTKKTHAKHYFSWCKSQVKVG